MIINEIEEKIKALYLEDSIAQRVVSLSIENTGYNYIITVWQCNMARMKLTDLKLPTVLKITLDMDAIVLDAELMETFKGSQGIPCSYKYLNKHLKKVLTGVSFIDDKKIIKDPSLFQCRHIFELVSGSAAFFRYSNKELPVNTLYNITKAFEIDGGLILKDSLVINGREYNASDVFKFSLSDITIESDGKVSCIKHLYSLFKFENGYSYAEPVEQSIDAVGSSNVIGLLKIFTNNWKKMAKNLNIKHNFVFTNFLPSSIYGLFIQSLALLLFKDNYNNFQLLLSGLQRKDSVPLCIGIVNDINELQKYFPECSINDLM